MIFWKRSSFIDSVRHSAGSNYFFYLKALQIFFSKESVQLRVADIFFILYILFGRVLDTQEIKWFLEDPAEARPRHEVTETKWEISRSAASGFGCFCTTTPLLVQEGKNEAGEHTDLLCSNRNQMSLCPQAWLSSWNRSRGLDTGRQDRCVEAARKVE